MCSIEAFTKKKKKIKMNNGLLCYQAKIMALAEALTSWPCQSLTTLLMTGI